MKQRTDKNNHNLTMAYYPAGNGNYTGKIQSIGVTLGGSEVTLRTYTYNANSTVATMTEYLSPTATRVTTYTWDSSGLNLMQTVVAGSGTSVQTTYTYDNLGRRTSRTLTRGGVALTTSYAYDAMDRVTSVTDPMATSPPSL